MTDTAQTLITDCMKELGVYGPGETPAPADLTDGLQRLNDLLDSWSLDAVAVFRIAQVSHSFVVGQGSYTIGEAGGEDVDAARPIEVQAGSFVRDDNSHDHPLTILRSRQDYDGLVRKSTASDYPRAVFYDPTYPSGTLHYYTVPSQAWTAYLNVPAVLSQFSGLTTAYSFPPGYRRALRTNGAVEMASMFDVEPRASLVRAARTSLLEIKRHNLAQRGQPAVRVSPRLRRGRGSVPSAARVQAGDY